MYLTLDIPAGVRDHGTDLEARGRWLESNFIRWLDGSVRPIGGWATRKASASAAAPRGALAWADNSGNSRIAFGSYEKLYVLDSGTTVTDITPVGFTTGNEDAAQSVGYGLGNYGDDEYGTPRPASGVFAECTTWALDTWGQNLIACSVDDGKIYEWTLSGAAAAVSNAPTSCLSALVTDERFLMALGAGGDPRKVQWSDREDNTTWTAVATNEAGDFILPTTGEIMTAAKVKGQALIITSTDCFTARYVGTPFVYGFDRVGEACGVISRQAVTSFGEQAVWMGDQRFHIFNGSHVQELKCDIHDKIFTDINKDQKSKIFSVHNSLHKEVWWFYPSSQSNENDSYVIYNYVENWWAYGSLDRTAGVDASTFALPIWFDSSGDAFNHEYNYTYDGTFPYIESAPIFLGEGDQVMKVNDLLPDEDTQGEAEMTFKTRFYPNGTEYTYGAYTLTNPTSVRFTGRQIRVRVTGTVNQDWRVGKPRINVINGGRR